MIEQLLAQPVGEERWESVHYAPNRDAEGRVIGIYAVHTDVHDQKRNEDALRTRRVYQPALSHQSALQMMTESCAGHFDPAVLRVMFAAGYDDSVKRKPWRQTPPGTEPGEEERPRAGLSYTVP